MKKVVRYIALACMLALVFSITVYAVEEDTSSPLGGIETVNQTEGTVDKGENQTVESNETEESALEGNQEGSSSLGSASEISLETYSSGQSEENKPLVSVNCVKEKGKLNLTVSNESQDRINNAVIVFDDNSKLSSFNNLITLGTIQEGKSETISVRTVDIGHGILQKLSNSLGGFLPTIILIALCGITVLGIITSLFFFSRKQKRNFRVSSYLVVFMIVSVGLLYSLLVANKPEYKPLEQGINYSIKTDSNDCRFSLLYNQDIVKEKVSEKDVPIKFSTEYEYDENIPVTTEPTVKTEGKNGKKHVVTTTVYRNGKVDSSKSKEKVLEEPVTQVEIQGTKSVKRIENVEPKKSYVPDDSLQVGEYKLDTNISDSKENIGRKETTYSWDSDKNKMVKDVNVTKKPGTNIWRAGTLVVKSEKLKAKTKYIPLEEKEVGYTNVVSETIDGEVLSYYSTEIDSKTGKPLNIKNLTFVKEESKKPINGEKEVGLKKTEDVSTPCEEITEFLPDKWDNEKEVLEPGKDLVERVTSIMELDEETGEVTDKVLREVSRFVVQESEPAHVAVGSKVPNWVQEKEMSDQVQYNTIYIADDTGKLKGDEQEVIQQGKMGRLYTTKLVAVDEVGNKISSYEPKIVEKDALIKPTDEVIKVAKNSKLLKDK